MRPGALRADTGERPLAREFARMALAIVVPRLDRRRPFGAGVSFALAHATFAGGVACRSGAIAPVPVR